MRKLLPAIIPLTCLAVWVAHAVVGYGGAPSAATISRAPGAPVASAPTAAATPNFDAGRALAHVRRLGTDIGPRPLGSAAEGRAREYIRAQLRAAGWQPTLQGPIRLPGTKLTTWNVVSARNGSPGGPVIVLGAHYDSCALGEACPGANDNGSGVATVLELARVLARTPPRCELRLLFFGGEERTREQPELHHVGSDYYVARMGEAERARILAMVSVDMLGAGGLLCASRVGFGSDRARQQVQAAGDACGLRVETDTGKAWSDHEAFELAGIPSVWLSRCQPSDHWHTADDVPSRVKPECLAQAGKLLLEFLRAAGQSCARPALNAAASTPAFAPPPASSTWRGHPRTRSSLCRSAGRSAAPGRPNPLAPRPSG